MHYIVYRLPQQVCRKIIQHTRIVWINIQGKFVGAYNI